MPGESDLGVWIYMDTVSLADNPDYEALSYCWGDPDEPVPVFCGEKGDKIIWVTRGLFSALRRLRLPTESRTLWVDAVCINQSDNNEKGCQVRLMTEIYMNARRTIIWLGEQSGDSALLQNFVGRLLNAREKINAAGDNARLRSVHEFGLAERKQYGIPETSDFRYKELLRLSARPWFRRVWIIQEVASAKHQILLCGHWSMPFTSFSKAWELVAELGIFYMHIPLADSDISSVSILSSTIKLVSEGIPQSLLNLLVRHRSSRASDPRDKVFALAGLATENENGTLVDINYNKSTQQVYTDIAYQILLKTRNLDILSSVTHLPNEDDETLPSWVPDWRVRGCANALTARKPIAEDEPYFNSDATRSSSWLPLISARGTKLGVRGYILDHVVQVGRLWPDFDDLPKTYLDLACLHADMDLVYANWRHMCDLQRTKLYPLTGESMLDVFRQTIMATQTHENPDPVLLELNEIYCDEFAAYDEDFRKNFFFINFPFLFRTQFGKMLYSILCLVKRWGFVFLRFVGIKSKWDAESFQTRFSAAFGRRMIIAKDSFLGLATGNVETGDTIVLLEGGRVPFIIRRTARKDEFYFVGDCYVHGHMYGSSWDPSKCEPIWLI